MQEEIIKLGGLDMDLRNIMSQTGNGKAEEIIFNTLSSQYKEKFGKEIDLEALGIDKKQAIELIRKSIECGKNLLEKK